MLTASTSEVSTSDYGEHSEYSEHPTGAGRGFVMGLGVSLLLWGAIAWGVLQKTGL